MGKLKDLTGRVFWRLTVVGRAGSNKFKKALWLCRCECGKESTHIGSGLLNGSVVSCGCYRTSGDTRRTHGRRSAANPTKAYRAWCNMKSRCTNPKDPGWKNYGGRGIAVCGRWLESFENFLEDMGEPPPGKSLDRLNNDAGYCKENCEWRTRRQQRRNSRGGMVWVTIEGERMILRDAVEKCKVVSFGAAMNRIHRGWKPEEAVLTPYTRSDNKGYRPQPRIA